MPHLSKSWLSVTYFTISQSWLSVTHVTLKRISKNNNNNKNNNFPILRTACYRSRGQKEENEKQNEGRKSFPILGIFVRRRMERLWGLIGLILEWEVESRYSFSKGILEEGRHFSRIEILLSTKGNEGRSKRVNGTLNWTLNVARNTDSENLSRRHSPHKIPPNLRACKIM